MSKLGFVVAAILAASAMLVAWQSWQSLADVQVSTAGIVAMILGGLATLGLGAGLMALLFISNRKGFDERAADATIVKQDQSWDEAEERPRPLPHAE